MRNEGVRGVRGGRRRGRVHREEASFEARILRGDRRRGSEEEEKEEEEKWTSLRLVAPELEMDDCL